MEQIITSGVALTGKAIVSEFVKLTINTYIKPRLEEHKNKRILERDLCVELEESFEEYINRCYEKHSTMNTLVFKNEQKKINDLYIPLTVKKLSYNFTDNEIEILMDNYKKDFIPKYKKLLLVDYAGMGKSTIIKHLYISIIEENRGIPILIELRKLKNNVSILDFIMNELNGINKDFNKQYILDLMEGGDFIFFFDGYDEIANEDRQEVTARLQDFISKTNKNLFLLSSREEKELSCFGDFQKFKINPLKKEEAFDLLRKYDLKNKNSLYAEKLIEQIEDEKNLKILNEFLINPLMVSLLYKAYKYKEKIPYKKYIFYRQVYDALFEDHDMTKNGAYIRKKKSGLDIEDFHRMLRYLGYLSFAKGNISFTKEEFNNLLREVKSRTYGIEAKENDLIYDLTRSVPLFLEDGVEYRWVHKSFQEYFAACYIYIDSENKKEILKVISSNNSIDRYLNILDFYYDLDIKTFRSEIIYPIISNFIEYYNNALSDGEFKEYDDEELSIRKEVTFISDDIDIIIYKNIYEFENSNKRGTLNGIWRYIPDPYNVQAIIKKIKYSKLLELLDDKELKIIKYLKNKDIFRSDLLETVGNIEPGVYKFDDKIFNGEENFKNINILLSGLSPSHSRNFLVLDYNECVKFKKDIENEKNLNCEDISLL